MTWLEIMEVLDKMPLHLLKKEAELWHYDDEGNYEILPIDDSVSPLNDSASDEEWGPGGDCRLSLQSFDVDRKPELKEYVAIINRSCYVSIMAKDRDQAQEIGESLANCRTKFARDCVNDAMRERGNDFFGVTAPENVSADLTLDASDSMKVLNEEE